MKEGAEDGAEKTTLEHNLFVIMIIQMHWLGNTLPILKGIHKLPVAF